MIDKTFPSVHEAVADVFDGAVVMVGGFGEAGSPIELIHALIDQGARELTVVSNNCGSGEVGLAALFGAGRVRKVICSFPRANDRFPELFRSGRCELEPRRTLAEHIRLGRGHPGVPTAAVARRCRGQGVAIFRPRPRARPATLRSSRAARRHARECRVRKPNFGPIMAMAADVAIVQAQRIVAPGQIDPETVVTPGIFTKRVVEVATPAHESELVAAGATYP